MIDQLKDLKDTFDTVCSQINRGKEPFEDLVKLKNFIQYVQSDVQGVLNEKMDKEYRKFFLEDFTNGLLKRLTRERSRDEAYLNTIRDILEAYLSLFLDLLRTGVNNQQFFDSMKFLFEFDSMLHSYNYQIPEEELKKLRSANQEWRKELKEGDWIDAIAEENNVRYSGWSQAKISSVNGDMLQLEYIFDVKSVDKYMDRWSVEIAPFESKTKENWEWKESLKIGSTVDSHDKSVWNKSTILDIKEQQISPTRIVKMAFIGYRVYSDNGAKTDERGAFDGWSSKFDEWISLYSPRIQPFMTKSMKGVSDDFDIDEELDYLIKPEQEDFTRVYAVPRIRLCISSVFLHLINIFGNKGGFDLILQLLSKQEEPEQKDQENGTSQSIDLNLLATIIQCISYPYMVYHQEFIVEYGPKFVDVCLKRLKDAPEKSLRDVRREKIESIIKSIDNFQRRLISKDEREKQTEILKLEISLMCLKSSYLERRIQGIRDLNQIIKNQRMFSANKDFTAQFLVEWMFEHEVFSILFDAKKTHLQIVQRTTDILKLLLSENMLTQDLLNQFFSLAKSDYKFEIYKIINECSFYFMQEHIDYFYDQIRQIPSEKIGIEEFQCLSELGKFAKEEKFKEGVSQFFWSVICNSENVKEELVNACITKFCEMVKNWDLRKKHQFFVELTKNLQDNKSSIPSFRLFKGLIKDQREKTSYQSGSGYNSSPSKTGDQADDLTLQQSLLSLINEHDLIKVILANLSYYCQLAHAKVTESLKNEPRKKLFLVNSKYSHHDEIDERLSFLKYFASVSPDYQVSKSDLNSIYELLVANEILSSDSEEFLTWCKSSCEQSSTYSQILDLNEVGQFFTEKMTTGGLDVKNLLVVGFDFLQQYFLSVNESSQKILRVQPKQKQAKYTSYGYTVGYGYNANGQYGPKMPSYQGGQSKGSQEDQEGVLFKLTKSPQDLDQLDIVWNMALQCQNPKVVPKAIDFLIKVYYSLDTDLEESRVEIQEELICKCMQILRDSQDAPTIIRVLDIIKHILFETEKKGTGDVKPHNALLKGELLERIQIKNKASPKSSLIQISIYSNATIWEFKKTVAQQLDLAPKYLKLERLSGTIKDSENGKTMGEMGIQSQEVITAFKIQIEEDIPNAPLIGPDGRLSEKAKQIFNDWFDLYSDDSGQMTKETCTLFIKGCTGEQPAPKDERIENLFKIYDSNSDGKIEREEFMQFYETAAKNKPETVRENLKSHNIRNDLKKLSEIQEDSSFKTEDMPRFKISRNQDQFDLLISLLDRQDQASQASWDLIQMLSTNQELYKRVLGLKTALDPVSGKIDWTKFFDNQSVYKLLYTLQIVEAVMEEGEGEGMEKVVISADSSNSRKNIPNAPPLEGAVQTAGPQQPEEKPSQEQESVVQQDIVTSIKRTSVIVNDEEEDKKLKSEWTKMFLEHQGFQYILEVFMKKEIQSETNSSPFELKHIAFLLKLLRIFIMAAFSTSTESQIYQASQLIRRSSSSHGEEDHNVLKNDNEGLEEGSRFKELQKLLTAGNIGDEIISQIDYKQLQQKILTIISQILSRAKQSPMTFEDKLIIENALSLWVGCIMHKNELMNDFYQYNSDEFVLEGLLFCEQEKVREEFKQSLGLLSHKLLRGDKVQEIPLLYLLRLLSSKFELISQYHCKQYFELFCELVDHYFTLRNLSGEGIQQEIFNPETLLSLIIDKIKEYNQLQGQEQQDTQQQQIQQDQEDSLQTQVSEQEEIYIGLIQLTSKIIDNFDISLSEKIVESKKLIDEIFVQFLFASVFKQDQAKNNEVAKIIPKRNQRSQQSSNKKQTFGKKSKDSAYKLINSLIRKSPLLMNSFLEKSMVPLMQLIKKHDGWNYTPPGSSDRQQKYVGLRNPSCICYMNSMLQQFFMIPAFRYNLLSVDDHQPEDIQEYRGMKIDDNMLHQLQKLMANLELSERSDFQPLEFCFAFKDLDGNPTNLAEQKDAQEFLNLAFDRIENMLRTTSMKYLLQSIFGGQTCSQLVCLECGKVKNRIEDFYNLSVTVKDIKSLHDSLQKLIEGEVINDFQCDTCNKKVDVSKRTLISQAPNVLIVHLQRIIFNFETFRNDKINSFFDFPTHLDLKPYSFYEVMKKENRLKKENNGEGDEDNNGGQQQQQVQDEDQQWPEEEECFEYKLVGVNVHSGTAHAGHYWSFINTRRGQSEPAESDPEWAKTENDPWMKFNDSSVSDYNIEKLKEDCFGGDGKAGESDFSFGGSYGQSAYMLVYEKRLKRPIKVLCEKDSTAEGQVVMYDSKKDEHYKLIDYRQAVSETTPTPIYNKVFEDNFKFEFENDIYSSEFFEFVKGIIQSISHLDRDRKNHGQLLEQAKGHMMTVAKKTILELLAKCFYNSSIKQLCEALVETLVSDDNLCHLFLEQCFKEDDCKYLLEILLDCTDSTARTNVANLIKFILIRLKDLEKKRLYEVETVERLNDKGEKISQNQYKALSSRFIAKCLSILNTDAAKNWAKFDSFLEILYIFGLGSAQDMIYSSNNDIIENNDDNNGETIGLEFYFRNRFIERACDFILGKKSPLMQIGEKRPEMGGSFSGPNFSPIIRLITKMISNQQLMEKYPLSETERKMFLHQEMLKVMLGSSGSSKQFGHCLASMCRNDEKLSRKVSKVFLKAINGSNSDNLKNYLKALKPFLRIDDSLKTLKLEWVFGFAQLVNRKAYREETYKYGLELIDRINEEAYIYVSPVSTDESLFAQLLKCKGKMDTNCIACLQEMLSLMAKDDLIGRFVYRTQPPTYQLARFIDWIRPYLEVQRQETEKSNSYNSYFKNKYESIVKSIRYLDSFESRAEIYREEELNSYTQNPDPERDQSWLAYQNPDVVKHFPPQLVIGRQCGEEREILVEDSDENVKVSIYEVQNEYNYSNPTYFFNLSLPHIEAKTSMYQTMSYTQFKKIQLEDEKKAKEEEEGKQINYENTQDTETSEQKDPREISAEKDPEIQVVNWFENKKEGQFTLLKVLVSNKQKKKISVSVKIESSGDNIYMTKSYWNDKFLDNDTKLLCHIQKVDPKKPWGELKVTVQSKESLSNIPAPPKTNYTPSANMSGMTIQIGNSNANKYVECYYCKAQNDFGMDYCDKCGESMRQTEGGDVSVQVMQNYFTSNEQGSNFMH